MLDNKVKSLFESFKVEHSIGKEILYNIFNKEEPDLDIENRYSDIMSRNNVLIGCLLNDHSISEIHNSIYSNISIDRIYEEVEKKLKSKENISRDLIRSSIDSLSLVSPLLSLINQYQIEKFVQLNAKYGLKISSSNIIDNELNFIYLDLFAWYLENYKPDECIVDDLKDKISLDLFDSIAIRYYLSGNKELSDRLTSKEINQDDIKVLETYWLERANIFLESIENVDDELKITYILKLVSMILQAEQRGFSIKNEVQEHEIYKNNINLINEIIAKYQIHLENCNGIVRK